MAKAVDELVKMRDVESLYELMAGHEDWMIQLDAAEGLVKLDDRRGYDFLIEALDSEDRDVREVAREILDSPDLRRMTEAMEALRRRRHEEYLDVARLRLQKGSRVFQYRMIHLAAGEILSEDGSPEGFDVPALNELGLQGWEVVNMIPRRREFLVGSVDDHFTGAYFLLKREVRPDEGAALA